MNDNSWSCECRLPAIWVYEIFCPCCGLRFYMADGCTCGCPRCKEEAYRVKGEVIWELSIQRETGELIVRPTEW